ncbi:hypothetical protein [Paenibacillus dendritiformis]|uniref:hypothetical protein n=1 Tax=Paenibacillus dendritiformis TaxID=130049 RepID=UPI00387E0748
MKQTRSRSGHPRRRGRQKKKRPVLGLLMLFSHIGNELINGTHLADFREDKAARGFMLDLYIAIVSHTPLAFRSHQHQHPIHGSCKSAGFSSKPLNAHWNPANIHQFQPVTAPIRPQQPNSCSLAGIAKNTLFIAIKNCNFAGFHICCHEPQKNGDLALEDRSSNCRLIQP